ncbi:hypothetical protein K8P10_000786 [Leucobacter sp. Psy1]|uniref:RNA polymerase sigma factor n=1 Tax=Leucobacter sp. Psy1 TaxID=2875729 RepID=UPI001CD6FF87|nr:sigma-70 family RNA polymerase sigma factor [Leucobacter sp. Psy1]UBH05275.1 hypothetical protein K8P10_000786 [Leucobacter sp. Psy1]
MTRETPDPGRTLSDEELCGVVRDGATWPLAVLWDRHHASARGWALKKDPRAGEDATAEAFTLVFQALRSGGGPTASFRGYLFKTIDSALVKHWNAERRTSPLDDLGEFAVDDAPDHAEALTDAQDRRAAAVALQELPDRWREIIVAVDVEQRPVQDVASELGLSPNAASVLLKRAREGLRKAWIERLHRPVEALPHDCAKAVRHFGTVRWGKRGTRTRKATERHLETCESCPSRYRLFLEQATAVGLSLAGLLALTRGWKEKFVPALATSATIVASFSVTVSLEPLFDPPPIAEPAGPAEVPQSVDNDAPNAESKKEQGRADAETPRIAEAPVSQAENDYSEELADDPLNALPHEAPGTNDPPQIGGDGVEVDDGKLYFGDWTGWNEDTETFNDPEG